MKSNTKTSTKTWIIAAAVTAMTAPGYALNIPYDGGPDGTSPNPNTSGSFNTGTNFVGDVVPGTADVAQLTNVTIDREVTVDSPVTVGNVTIAQTTATATNTLTLRAGLTSSQTGTFTFGSATNANSLAGVDRVVTNLGGQTLAFSNAGNVSFYNTVN
ncbi:MAG TPA: hypothetical protein VF624_03480, partial [Tepidisphaeraceae bacterium]